MAILKRPPGSSFGFVALSTGPYTASSCRTLALLEHYAPSNRSSQHAQTLRSSFRLPRSFLALVWCSNCISSPFWSGISLEGVQFRRVHERQMHGLFLRRQAGLDKQQRLRLRRRNQRNLMHP